MIKIDNVYFMFKITLQTYKLCTNISHLITHRLISAGSHWLKLLMWQVARWLSEDYPHSELISVWFYFDRRKNWKRANVWAKTVLQKPVTEKSWSWLSIPYQETRKQSTKYAGTADLRTFPLRNLSEGYKINKTSSGLLIYRRIMPSADRLSSKFHN